MRGIHSPEDDTSCFGHRPQLEMSHTGRLSAAQSSLMDFFFNKVRVRRGADEEKMKETRNTEGEMKGWGMGLGARKVKSAPVSLSCLLQPCV